MKNDIKIKLKSHLFRIAFVSFLIFIILVVTTFGSWIYLTKNIVLKDINALQNYTRYTKETVDERIAMYASVISGFKGLFLSSVSVERNEFRDFYNNINRKNIFHAIHSISYAELVKEKDKNTFINSVRNDKTILSQGYPGFEIKPQSKKSEYLPIKYVESSKQNSDLFGTDLLADSAFSSLYNALKSKDEIRTIYTTQNNQKFVSVYLPIFKNESTKEIQGVLRTDISLSEIVDEVFQSNVPDNVVIGTYVKNSEDVKDFYTIKSDSISKFDTSLLEVINKDNREVIFFDSSWNITFTLYKVNEYFGLSNQTVFYVFITFVLLNLLALALINYFSYLSYELIRKNLLSQSAIKEEEMDLNLRNRALSSAVEAIVITDYQEEGKNPIIYANEAFEKITGYSLNEVRGKDPSFLHAQDRDQEALGILKMAIKNKTTAEVVVRNYKKDGTMYYANVSIAPVFDENKNLTHYIGVQTDITERKKNEEALAKKALELTRLNDSLVGRELKMIEMKRELEQLKNKNSK